MYCRKEEKHKEVTTIGIKAYFNDVPTLRHNSLDEHIIGAVAQCLQIILVISKLDDEIRENGETRLSYLKDWRCTKDHNVQNFWLPENVRNLQS